MSGFVERENQIFEILQEFNDVDLEFVVVSGYAGSAIQHRFSVDADLVIQGNDLDEFTKILEREGFEEVEDRDLISDGRFLAYEKDRELPVTIDLLVGSLQCRQTDATWSYEEIAARAEPVEIGESESTVEVRIPEPELLMAMKLHSGRLTDERGVVALAEDVDYDRATEYLYRGDLERLHTALERVQNVIASDGFAGSFKGVFASTELPVERIEAVQTFVAARVEELSESE